MSERSIQAGKPPSRRGKVSLVSRQGEHHLQAAARGRRGRLSREEYIRAVCAVIRWDPFRLDDCALLGQLPGVRGHAQQLSKAIFPTGTAIHRLIERSVEEVEQLAEMQRDAKSQRVARFLEVWYRQRGTVVSAAEALDLSRSYVAHRIQPHALELVAQRFLDLAWQVEASV
jgi:hypothetical protein